MSEYKKAVRNLKNDKPLFIKTMKLRKEIRKYENFLAFLFEVNCAFIENQKSIKREYSPINHQGYN
jgi:hypothetical protein